jgi:perosamine synthetase
LAGVFGPEAVGLEADFAHFCGSKYAMATGSGTSALHCAMFAAGVGPGDEVITSAFSFSGSFHPILQQNAIPVFVDIDPRTYNIDVKQIEAKISDKTKALLPVHIHGLPADMDPIMQLAGRYGLTVIEDACQAHGAEYKGRKAGTIGKAGCFSLNWTKNLSGGEGGLMITDDAEFLDRAKQLRIFGEKPAGHEQKTRAYTVHSVGYQYRTQELPAALARSQLKRLDDINRNTQANCGYLTEHLSQIPGLIPPYVPADRSSIYHKYRVRFQPDVLKLRIPTHEFRDRLIDALEAEGVPAMIWHVEPLPAFPIFQEKVGWGKGCPWSCKYYGRDIQYRGSDYPETIKLLDESFIIGDEHAPIYSQSREAMKYYVAAFHKIFDNLDDLLG